MHSLSASSARCFVALSGLIALFLLSPDTVRAQYPYSGGGSYVWTKTDGNGNVTSQSPAYSGGTASIPYGDGTTKTYNYGPVSTSQGTAYGTPSVEAYFTPTSTTATSKGQIKAAFQWDNGGNANNLPPPAVIVTETGSVNAMASNGTATGDDGVGQTGAYVSGTLYSGINIPGAGFSKAESPSATATNVGSGYGGAYVTYAATASPSPSASAARPMTAAATRTSSSGRSAPPA